MRYRVAYAMTIDPPIAYKIQRKSWLFGKWEDVTGLGRFGTVKNYQTYEQAYEAMQLMMLDGQPVTNVEIHKNADAKYEQIRGMLKKPGDLLKSEIFMRQDGSIDYDDMEEKDIASLDYFVYRDRKIYYRVWSSGIDEWTGQFDGDSLIFKSSTREGLIKKIQAYFYAHIDDVVANVESVTDSTVSGGPI